ncbi:MAG: hypothetical protein JWM59_2126 [Verrucomicrobiales bacterium]|nr:hypothetical protein [Verrucomicrobiales bacterium]
MGDFFRLDRLLPDGEKWAYKEYFRIPLFTVDNTSHDLFSVLGQQMHFKMDFLPTPSTKTN